MSNKRMNPETDSPKKVSAWSKLRDSVQDEENLKMRNFIIDSVLKPVS